MPAKRKFQKSAKQLNTLDKVLIILAIFLALFVIAMIIIFICFQAVPDSLIIAVLGSGSSEAILCCVITCVKKKIGINED